MMSATMTSTLRTLLPSFGGRAHRQSALTMSRGFCFDDFDDFDDRQKKMMMMTTTKPSPPNDSILRAMCFSSSRFSLSRASSTSNYSIWRIPTEKKTRFASSFSSSRTRRSFLRLPRKRKTTTQERTYLLCGETPPEKKGSAFTRANNMHASVAILMGRRAVRESFTALTTKLSKKSGYYKGKRSVSPGWHEKKVGGGGKGRFVLLDWKKPTYVIPEGLNAFTLKAYVAKGVTK